MNLGEEKKTLKFENTILIEPEKKLKASDKKNSGEYDENEERYTNFLDKEE